MQFDCDRIASDVRKLSYSREFAQEIDVSKVSFKGEVHPLCKGALVHNKRQGTRGASQTRMVRFQGSSQALHILFSALVADIDILRYLRRALKNASVSTYNDKTDSCLTQNGDGLFKVSHRASCLAAPRNSSTNSNAPSISLERSVGVNASLRRLSVRSMPNFFAAAILLPRGGLDTSSYSLRWR